MRDAENDNEEKQWYFTDDVTVSKLYCLNIKICRLKLDPFKTAIRCIQEQEGE